MFGLFTEHDDVDEADFFFQLIALLETPTRRQTEAGNRRPAGRIPQLRVPGQISDQDDFIEPRQRWLLVVLLRTGVPLGGAGSCSNFTVRNLMMESSSR